MDRHRQPSGVTGHVAPTVLDLVYINPLTDQGPVEDIDWFIEVESEVLIEGPYWLIKVDLEVLIKGIDWFIEMESEAWLRTYTDL